MSNHDANRPPRPGDHPAVVTQLILGRKILTGFAVTGFVTTLIVLGVATFQSGTIDTAVARSSLLLLVAFALTTVAWLLYPKAVEATDVTVPILGWKITGFSGPLLLLIVTYVVLDQVYPVPAPPRTRYYALEGAANPPPASAVRFNGSPSHDRLLPVRDSRRPGSVLAGFVARFDSPDAFKVVISSEPAIFEPTEVTFAPGTNNGTFELPLRP